MGFKTLAIQKRSSEVWQILGAVKNEFGKFGDVLEKAQKKLNEARHGHIHKGETDRVGARKAGYMDATHCLHHVRANVCCEACVPIVEVVRLCEKKEDEGT